MRLPISKVVVYPYKIESRSAKLLAGQLTERLGAYVRCIRSEGNYRGSSRSIVINWGTSFPPIYYRGLGRICNTMAAVALASNKLRAFIIFKDNQIAIPEFTTSQEEAEEWRMGGATIVCRTLLSACGGRGIYICNGNDSTIVAPLYVKYKKKRREFRIHVFQDQVIDVVEKRRRNLNERPENFNPYIRNHLNGWVFCRDNVSVPDDVLPLARNAVHCLNLDFGAVDVIWNEHENKSYLLEVNTAPGLEGTTVEKYTQAIYNWIRNL